MKASKLKKYGIKKALTKVSNLLDQKGVDYNDLNKAIDDIHEINDSSEEALKSKIADLSKR